ncbi:MAG TPA: AraC family transcriptional regulator [Noviherbaspirillum sp.]|nr:AraC family transcriptional regulator [Noviherbaspirillum sp.]
MDTLSELLTELRLVSGFFLQAEFFAPWCIDSAPGKEDLHHILPGAEHVTVFHLLTEGQCGVRLPGASETWALQAGDVVIFPRGDAHLIGSDLQRAPMRAAGLVEPADGGGLMRISYGGGGERTRFICGFLSGDPRLCRPLLDSLPPVVRVPLCDPDKVSWIAETMRFATQESSAPGLGSGVILSRVSELIFVEALRRYAAALPEAQQGWLAGLRCPYISRALSLLHARPAHPWTVEELAAQAGLSRSALAERFQRLLGEPPLRYLTRWRLALAARQLRETQEPLIRIAERVGYESEAAFNRAFRREFGMPPAAWRRLRREAVDAQPAQPRPGRSPALQASP